MREHLTDAGMALFFMVIIFSVMMWALEIGYNKKLIQTLHDDALQIQSVPVINQGTFR